MNSIFGMEPGLFFIMPKKLANETMLPEMKFAHGAKLERSFVETRIRNEKRKSSSNIAKGNRLRNQIVFFDFEENKCCIIGT